MRVAPTSVALLATGGAGGVLLVGAAQALGGAWWPAAVPAGLLAGSFFLGGGAAVLGGGRHRAATRLLAVGALHLAAFGLAAATALALREEAAGAWLLNLASSVLFLLGFAAFVGLFAVFPTGRYERAYERRTTRVTLLLAVVAPLLDLLGRPTQALVLDIGSPPLTTRSPAHLAWVEPLAPLADAVGLLALVGVALFVLRYHRATGESRRAMRWPLVSAVAGAAGVAAGFVPGVSTLLADGIVVLALTSFPLAVVIGIRSSRLLDVDLVLARALAYAVLWSLIALVYGAGATAAGLAAGSRVDVQAAVVVTIITAMVFQPLRRRLERLADRLVRGRRPESYALLRELGARLEHHGAGEDVASAVVRTVARGLRPTWVRLRVRDAGGAWVTVASTGQTADGQVALSAPLSDAQGEVGTLECGPSSSGGWTDDDRDLLQTLARQAALAVRRARLVADLAASRARLVQAQDDERRRLERDLHDGAQQHLVALMAALEVARLQLCGDPVRVAATLQGAQDVARDAHRTLRELVRGIRPPVLGDRGLLAAVQAQLATLPLQVKVEAEPRMHQARFAPEIEAAAYFFVAEGLTNVVKHAGDAHVRVTVAADDHALHVGVLDDGCGFDGGVRPRGGLCGLRDRVEALGGGLVLEASPGHGTQLRAVLPVQVPRGG